MPSKIVWRTPTEREPECAICSDQYFYVPDVPASDKRFGKAIPCPCRSEVREQMQQRSLREIDGLTDEERGLRFSRLTPQQDNSPAETIQDCLAARKGFVTLTGKPGRGKSTLLICAVNQSRNAGLKAVYAKTSDILDYLRRAYDPKSEESGTADERWNLLVSAHVLAIDELDQFKSSEWAMEKFLALIDERWRNIHRLVTLTATNTTMDRLPEKVASRLTDRRARLFQLAGPDMRKFNTWEVAP